jgi:hypothetical protein
MVTAILDSTHPNYKTSDNEQVIDSPAHGPPVFEQLLRPI